MAQTQNLPAVQTNGAMTIHSLSNTTGISAGTISSLINKFDISVDHVEMAIDITNDYESNLQLATQLVKEHDADDEVVRCIYEINRETSMPLKDISELVSKFGLADADQYIELINDAIRITAQKFPQEALTRLMNLARDPKICWLDQLANEFDAEASGRSRINTISEESYDDD